MLRAALLTLALSCALAYPALAGLEEGLAAYKRGDYETALREFRKAAAQGHARAQTYLGFMYANGKGVPEDDVEAVRWYRKAAEQGYADAQSNLGVSYLTGEGVPEDYIEAYKWFNLMAAQGDEKAAEVRDLLQQHMTPSQIAQAQARTRKLRPN